MESRDLDNRFAYHPPSTSHVADSHERVRRLHRHAAGELVASCPDSRELSLAVTKLEESMMWANAALARHQRSEQRAMESSAATYDYGQDLKPRAIRDEPQA